MKFSINLDFIEILTIVFITLKLTGFISWSWWWVLSPILIPLMILIVALSLLGCFILFAKITFRREDFSDMMRDVFWKNNDSE